MNNYDIVCMAVKENVNLYAKECKTETPVNLKRYFATMHYSAMQEWNQATTPEEKQTLFKTAMLFKNLFLDAARKTTRNPMQKITVCWTNPHMKPVMARMDEIQ